MFWPPLIWGVGGSNTVNFQQGCDRAVIRALTFHTTEKVGRAVTFGDTC